MWVVFVKGKKAKVGDEMDPPDVIPLRKKDIPAPACSNEVMQDASWFDEKVR